MKRVMLVVALVMATSYGVHAGTSVNWYINWGIYPHGAPDLSSVAAGTGVAGSQAVLWQLIYAGTDNTINPVDLSKVSEGYVGGDDQVLFTRTIAAGGTAPWSEFLDGSASASTNGVTYADPNSKLYQRVFGSTSPQLLDYYYDSPTLSWENKNPETDPEQSFNGNTTISGVGDALNIQIVPEPSTVALMLVGLGLVGYRRLRRA